MSREVSDISLRWTDKGLRKLSARVGGGETGEHFVEYLDGTYNCDCFGFGRHKHCRHVDALRIMKKALEINREAIWLELNR